MGTLFRQTAAAALASTPRDNVSRPYLARAVVRRVDEAAARPVDDVVIREDHGDLARRLVKQPLGKLRQQAVVVADDREELSCGRVGEEVPVAGEAEPPRRLQIADALIRRGALPAPTCEARPSRRRRRSGSPAPGATAPAPRPPTHAGTRRRSTVGMQMEMRGVCHGVARSSRRSFELP